MRIHTVFCALLLVLMVATGAYAQTLVYGISGEPTSMDSADAKDGNSLTVSAQVTEPLIFFEPGTTNLVPWLATEWTPNEDASAWTIALRQGVTFHDGTPFNAEAVKFNFDRWNNTDHEYRGTGKTFVPWQWVFGGTKGEGSILDELEVVDDYTVILHLTKGAGLLPNMLAAIYFQMDSPAAVMEHGENYGTPSVGSVGTGPFTFVAWKEGEKVELARNDDYWQGPAQVETVVVRGISEPTARLAELQAGTIDIAVLLSSDDLSIVEADESLQVVIPASELNVGYLAMHQANPPFDNPLVRQAIAQAIDREAIVEAFYEGLGAPAKDFLPPDLWGHSDFEAYPYDPEAAQALLAEAGYTDGFTTELWYMPVSRPYYPAPQPIAEAMASYLADIGINAELKTEDWSTYLQDYSTGKFPMYMLGWNGDYADPDNFLFTFFGPTATDDLGWNDPATVELLQLARQATTPGARQALYAAIGDRVYEQAPSIPVAHNRSLNALRQGIDGWHPSPLGYSSVSLHGVTKSGE